MESWKAKAADDDEEEEQQKEQEEQEEAVWSHGISYAEGDGARRDHYQPICVATSVRCSAINLCGAGKGACLWLVHEVR